MFHGLYEGQIVARTELAIRVAVGHREAFTEIADARLVDVRPGDLVRSTWRDDRPVSITVAGQNGERFQLRLA